MLTQIKCRTVLFIHFLVKKKDYYAQFSITVFNVLVDAPIMEHSASIVFWLYVCNIWLGASWNHYLSLPWNSEQSGWICWCNIVRRVILIAVVCIWLQGGSGNFFMMYIRFLLTKMWFYYVILCINIFKQFYHI